MEEKSCITFHAKTGYGDEYMRKSFMSAEEITIDEVMEEFVWFLRALTYEDKAIKKYWAKKLDEL